MVVEISGVHSWGDNRLIDFFSKVGGTEVKFGQAGELCVEINQIL